MLKYKNRIVFTGGTGRFANAFKIKQTKTKLHFYFPNKKQLDILKINSIKKYLRKKKTKIFNSFSWTFKAYEFT